MRASSDVKNALLNVTGEPEWCIVVGNLILQLPFPGSQVVQPPRYVGAGGHSHQRLEVNRRDYINQNSNTESAQMERVKVIFDI